jgi:hypothetical protein
MSGSQPAAVRGGTRDEAFWDGVRADRQRGNFLGASIKAAPQRPGAGDPQWYVRKTVTGAQLSAAEELAQVREREREQLESRLGLRPTTPRQGEAGSDAARPARRDRDQIVPEALRAHAASSAAALPSQLLLEEEARPRSVASKRRRRDDDARRKRSASCSSDRSSSSSKSSSSSSSSSRSSSSRSKERRRRLKRQKRVDKKERKRAKKAAKKVAKEQRRSRSPRR